MAELTIAHKPLIKAIELLGYQAAETIDREVELSLRSTTNVFYLGNVASRSAMATTSITQADLSRIVASLRANGAMGLEKPSEGNEDPVLGDNFVGIIDPYVEMDLLTLPNWVSSNQYQASEKLWNGEAGKFMGVRFIRSNHIPALTRGASVTTATMVTAGGSISGASAAGATKVGMVITGVDTATGYERLITDHATLTISTSTAMGSATNTGAFNVTVPASAGFTYNIYMTLLASAAVDTATMPHYIVNGGCGIAASGQATVTDIVSTTRTVPAALASGLSSPKGVHLSYFLGKDAFTVVNLENLRSYLTPATESDSDPLLQRRKAGWKVFFKSVINNNAFLARLETPSAND